MPDVRDNKISCKNYQCEIEVTLEILSGKWKSLLIWELHLKGVIRYNEFRRILPKITQKMLTQQLRELVKYKIVEKKVYPSVPPMVEYSLSELGKGLIPIMTAMDVWGKNYVLVYENGGF